MATEKPPTKAEFLEALKENGINSLEESVDADFPETCGYSFYISEINKVMPLVTIPHEGSFAVKWYVIDDDEGEFAF